jgi:hypothetical protein
VIKDGASCPECGLANYEGLCPHCRGDLDAYEHDLVPPFPSERDALNEQRLEESHRAEEGRREDEAAALDR